MGAANHTEIAEKKDSLANRAQRKYNAKEAAPPGTFGTNEPASQPAKDTHNFHTKSFSFIVLSTMI